MRSEVFVDSGAWLAPAHDRDQYHQEAAKLYPRLLADSGRLVTTNLVVAECHSLLLKYKGRGTALTFVDTMKQSPRIEVVYADARIEAEAIEVLRRFGDQDFSYTDAVSFALMKLRGIHMAFAFDRHFATAGFKPIP